MTPFLTALGFVFLVCVVGMCTAAILTPKDGDDA